MSNQQNVRWLLLNGNIDGAITALARLAMGNGRGASSLQETKHLVHMWMKQLEDPENHPDHPKPSTYKPPNDKQEWE